MVNISITLDDLDIIVKSLESADIYINDTEENERKFYDHMDELRLRLEKTLKKWEEVKKIDERIKWNKEVFVLGRGFSTVDEFDEAQKKLYEKRYSIIKERGE